MKIGDKVRLIGVPSGLEDFPDLPTKSTFEKCLGREFTVAAINEIGWAELKLVKAFWERLPAQKANRRTIMIRGFKPEAAIAYQEKRRSPRYPFIASAELIEEKADVRIASRVSELSLHGCYLDMMNPFPHGDSRPREDRRWRCIFPSQGQDHLLANEYGRRRELPPDRARIPGGAGALAGRGGERFPEAGRVIVPQCGAASTPVPTQKDVAAESTTNDN